MFSNLHLKEHHEITALERGHEKNNLVCKQGKSSRPKGKITIIMSLQLIKMEIFEHKIQIYIAEIAHVPKNGINEMMKCFTKNKSC